MHIRLLMYPVQMPSPMHLIFAKKAEDNVFWPTGWVGWAKHFHHDRIWFDKDQLPLMYSTSYNFAKCRKYEYLHTAQ